jgi:hypothetical protein
VDQGADGEPRALPSLERADEKYFRAALTPLDRRHLSK